MTQVFEEPNLTSDSLLESKQSTESIIREWFISQIKTKRSTFKFVDCGTYHDQTTILTVIRKILELADEGSVNFKITNFDLLEVITKDDKNNTNLHPKLPNDQFDDSPLYTILLNNQYTFSINGVVLMYDPKAQRDLKCQII